MDIKDEIQSGEYIRTRGGSFHKITGIDEYGLIYWKTNEKYEICCGYSLEQLRVLVTKHSNKLIDLIETGDLLFSKEDKQYWQVEDHQGNYIQTEWLVIETEEELLEKVSKIVTKEQIETIGYKMKEV